jgi:hypothetical protein
MPGRPGVDLLQKLQSASMLSLTCWPGRHLRQPEAERANREEPAGRLGLVQLQCDVPAHEPLNTLRGDTHTGKRPAFGDGAIARSARLSAEIDGNNRTGARACRSIFPESSRK